MAKHKEVHMDTLQPSALRSRGLGRIDVRAPVAHLLQVASPKLATMAHNYGQIQQALLGGNSSFWNCGFWKTNRT